MRILVFLTSAAALCAAPFAATGALSGVVKDINTAKPIANAIVRLAGKGLTDTSDGEGKFSFSFPFTALRQGFSQPAIQPNYLPGKGIVFSNPSREPVRVDILDFKGKVIATPGNAILDQGVWSLPIDGLPQGRYLCRIKGTSETRAFRFLKIDYRSGSGALEKIQGSGAGGLTGALAKASAEGVDTLFTSRDGYHSDTLTWNEKPADSVTIFLQDTASTRRFATVRTIIPFDMDWRFFKGEAAGADKAAFSDVSWRALNVPHDWSIEGPFDANAPTGGYGGYLPAGVGWYRKHFTLPGNLQGRRIFVEFDGVMANSEVWVNGVLSYLDGAVTGLRAGHFVARGEGSRLDALGHF